MYVNSVRLKKENDTYGIKSKTTLTNKVMKSHIVCCLIFSEKRFKARCQQHKRSYFLRVNSEWGKDRTRQEQVATRQFGRKWKRVNASTGDAGRGVLASLWSHLRLSKINALCQREMWKPSVLIGSLWVVGEKARRQLVAKFILQEVRLTFYLTGSLPMSTCQKQSPNGCFHGTLHKSYLSHQCSSCCIPRSIHYSPKRSYMLRIVLFRLPPGWWLALN